MTSLNQSQKGSIVLETGNPTPLFPSGSRVGVGRGQSPLHCGKLVLTALAGMGSPAGQVLWLTGTCVSRDCVCARACVFQERLVCVCV